MDIDQIALEPPHPPSDTALREAVIYVLADFAR